MTEMSLQITTQGITGIADKDKGELGKHLYSSFCEKEQVRQGKQFRSG
jgi:hypothetical protein